MRQFEEIERVNDLLAVSACMQELALAQRKTLLAIGRLVQGNEAEALEAMREATNTLVEHSSRFNHLMDRLTERLDATE